MLTMMRNKMKSQKGFTLVELMVVVVILGVLVAIAVPLYNAQTAKAEKAACQANQRIIESAIVQYSMEEGKSVSDITTANWDTQLATYLQQGTKCPSKGSYTITNGVVSCDYADDKHKRD